MSATVLAVGEKVHIITRRLFEEDPRRHLVGQVEAVSEGLARVRGHAFIFNSAHNEYEKRSGERVRIVSLSDARTLINVLPPDVGIDALHYAFEDGRLVVTDGAGYSLDINEFGPIT
jgi:hypothetical protein